MHQPGPALGVAAIILVGVAVLVSRLGRLGVSRQILAAAARAVVQLAGVSLIITAVLARLGWSLAFAAVMLAVASLTSASRIGAFQAWPWSALAITSGVIPSLAVIFVSGAVPWTPAALVPMAGIIIGGAMTANSLTGRRCFVALHDEHGSYEAALSIGLTRSQAIAEVIARHLPESLVPGLDQTRTVGLVTLPGAFVGVLLGGGSPVQAGAAQLLVLLGLVATQSITVSTASVLIRSARLLPTDLRTRLRP